MKTDAKFVAQPVKGLDQSVNQKNSYSSVFEWFTWDPQNQCWDNRLGWEPVPWRYGAFSWGPFSNTHKINSVYCWKTHDGARQYLMYEEALKTFSDPLSDMRLNYYIGNGPTFEILDDSRVTPAINQLGAHYNPFGKYLIITDGRNWPLKWNGICPMVLGFNSRPSPPRPWAVCNENKLPDSEGEMTILPTRVFPPMEPLSAGYVSPATVTGFRIDMVNSYGVGGTTDGGVNTYRYKVSFVKEDGSEGPLSPRSAPVTWTTPDNNRRQGVWIENIPVGKQEEGIYCRRIYRTKNIGDGNTAVGRTQNVEEEVYYFVAQIDNNIETEFMDWTPDTRLGANAPRDDQSVLMPARPTVTATFKNCLFIDGGEGNDGQIFYSLAGRPCQYQSLDYFGLGAASAGSITALVPFFDSLIVFRQNGIDMVTGNALDGFAMTPFVSGIGCAGKMATCEVPNLGIMFISQDGIYLIGGTVGSTGSNLQLAKMSKDVQEVAKRWNKDMLYKSVAVYSQKWKEAHFYFPFDGSTNNQMGLVFHTDNAQWTTRPNMAVNCATTDYNGEIIFGSWNGYGIGGAAPTAPDEAGLFYISRRRSKGMVVQGGGGDQPLIWTDPPTSKWRSEEHDFGYAGQKKAIKYAYLYFLSQGDNTLAMTYYMDRNIKISPQAAVTQELRIQRPEEQDQMVWGIQAFDTAIWERGHVIQVRYPIVSKKCSYFSFEFETTNDVQFLGYSLEFNTDNMRTRAGKKAIGA